MRGITTFIVSMGLLSVGMLVAIPMMDGMVPVITGMTPGSDPTIQSIRTAVVKWTVPVFLATMLLWVIFWVLRQEKQQVR